MSRAKYSLLEIEKPTDDQLGAITSLYRKAFGIEAETTFATLAGGREEEKKEAFIRAVVSAGKVVAAVKNDSEEIIGCAVWYSPKDTVETERQGPSAHDAPWPDLVNWKQNAANLLEEKSVGRNGERVVPWYLNIVAVLPEYQGMGILRAFIEDARRKSDGAEISLHASNKQNVQVYTRLGFTLIDTTDIQGPYGKLTYHLLVMSAA